MNPYVPPADSSSAAPEPLRWFMVGPDIHLMRGAKLPPIDLETGDESDLVQAPVHGTHGPVMIILPLWLPLFIFSKYPAGELRGGLLIGMVIGLLSILVPKLLFRIGWFRPKYFIHRKRSLLERTRRVTRLRYILSGLMFLFAFIYTLEWRPWSTAAGVIALALIVCSALSTTWNFGSLKIRDLIFSRARLRISNACLLATSRLQQIEQEHDGPFHRNAPMPLEPRSQHSAPVEY